MDDIPATPCGSKQLLALATSHLPACLATHLQGAFKKVAAEVEGCARELAAILRRRLLAAPDQAAECIQMIAKLGEPTESLQVQEGLIAADGGRAGKVNISYLWAAAWASICCGRLCFQTELVCSVATGLG